MSNPAEHVHSTTPGGPVAEGAGLGEADLPEGTVTETDDSPAMKTAKDDRKDYEAE